MIRSKAMSRGGSLSPKHIAQRAIAICDAEGLEGLSMRKLAKSFGVEAMSLYHHVPSKAALLSSVASELASELPELPKKIDWKEGLRGAAKSWRALALAHPGTFPLLATRAQSDRGLLERFAILLNSLERAGLSAVSRARSLNSFFFGLNGYLLAAGKPMVVQDVPEHVPQSTDEFGPLATAALSAIPPEAWELNAEENYIAHVELLIEGISAKMELQS